METLNLKDVRFPEAIQDPYMTCKYLERKGISLDDITLGNVHESIKEAVDDFQLPVIQVVNDGIEGYLIGV